jgi:hypothetical protein
MYFKVDLAKSNYERLIFNHCPQLTIPHSFLVYYCFFNLPKLPLPIMAGNPIFLAAVSTGII